MSPETLTALTASIKHWEANVEANHVVATSIKAKDCALCEAFNSEGWGGCEGCPVSAKTGQQSCDGSPYDDACGARRRWRILVEEGFDEDFTGMTVDEARDAWRVAAKAELDFLVSLLPENAQ